MRGCIKPFRGSRAGGEGILKIVSAQCTRTTWLLFFFIVNILFSRFCLQLKFWAFKINIRAHQLLIDTRKSFNLVFHIVPLRVVQVLNLYEPAAVQLHTDPLAHNFTRGSQVLQDGIVQGCEGADLGMLLLIFCTAFLRWLRQNSPLSNKDDMLSTELFLQFAH